MKLDLGRLEGFLADLDGDKEARRMRHAFEFRHESWFTTPVYRRLDAANHAIVHADMPFEVLPAAWRGMTGKKRIEAPRTADWWYLRRHGPQGVHTPYSDEQVRQDAAWISDALDERQDVYVY